MKQQLLYFFVFAIVAGILLYSPIFRKDKGRDIAHTAVDKIANKTSSAAQNTREYIADKAVSAANRIGGKGGGGSYAAGGSYAGSGGAQVVNQNLDPYYTSHQSFKKVNYQHDPKHYASQDLRLGDNNIKRLSGLSSANIDIYNKGIFYDGYKDIELKVISYDEQGRYIGHRYEIFRNEICEGETMKERLEVARGTDEIVTYITNATPTNCFDEKSYQKSLEQERRLAERNTRREDKRAGRTNLEEGSTPPKRNGKLFDFGKRDRRDRDVDVDHDLGGECNTCLSRSAKKYKKAQEKANRYKEEINRYCLSCKTWE